MRSSSNCKSLKALREADAGERAETAMAGEKKDNTGYLEVVNGMIGGEIDEEVA